MSKPYRDFPLFLHATGQWAKKVRGKTHYFGRDAEAAEGRWEAVKGDLLAGRTPRLHPADAPTLKVLVNTFLTSKRSLVDVGELSPVTWGNYYATCELLIEHLGKDRFVADLESIDFEKLRTELAKTRGAHALAGVIQRVRTLFKYGWDEGIIDKPVRFGTIFRKPSKKVVREARHESECRMIEAEDLRRRPVLSAISYACGVIAVG